MYVPWMCLTKSWCPLSSDRHRPSPSFPSIKETQQSLLHVQYGSTGRRNLAMHISYLIYPINYCIIKNIQRNCTYWFAAINWPTSKVFNIYPREDKFARCQVFKRLYLMFLQSTDIFGDNKCLKDVPYEKPFMIMIKFHNPTVNKPLNIWFDIHTELILRGL